MLTAIYILATSVKGTNFNDNLWSSWPTRHAVCLPGATNYKILTIYYFTCAVINLPLCVHIIRICLWTCKYFVVQISSHDLTLLLSSDTLAECSVIDSPWNFAVACILDNTSTSGCSCHLISYICNTAITLTSPHSHRPHWILLNEHTLVRKTQSPPVCNLATSSHIHHIIIMTSSSTSPPKMWEGWNLSLNEAPDLRFPPFVY